MTVGEFVCSARKALSSLYDGQEAAAIVGNLYGSVLGVPGYIHVTEPDMEISAGNLQRLESCMDRLLAAEPLQYVMGKAEFFGLEFNVSPSVLIPRPETELMCREFAEHIIPDSGIRRPAILDLCTGSGCIAWSLAYHIPDAAVTAADLSEEALSVASSQAIGNNAPVFVRTDVLGSAESIRNSLGENTFDFILGNPPYVTESEKSLMRRNVLDYEPSMALFVPDSDPLVFYRAIAAIASSYLSPGGVGAVEINEAFGPQVCDIFAGNGMSFTCLRQDLSGRDRFVYFSRQPFYCN